MEAHKLQQLKHHAIENSSTICWLSMYNVGLKRRERKIFWQAAVSNNTYCDALRAGRNFLLFLLTYQVQWFPLRAVLKNTFQFDKESAAVVVVSMQESSENIINCWNLSW